MSYMRDVQEYVESLSPTSQDMARSAIKRLRKESPSGQPDWHWLLTALNAKKKDDWERWGFGLLFDNGFRAQVQKTLKNEKQNEFNSDDIWVEDNIIPSNGTDINYFRQGIFRSNVPINKLSDSELSAYLICFHRSSQLMYLELYSQDLKKEKSELLSKWSKEDSTLTDDEIAAKLMRNATSITWYNRG